MSPVLNNSQRHASELTNSALHQRLLVVARRLRSSTFFKKRRAIIIRSFFACIAVLVIGYSIPSIAIPAFYIIALISIGSILWSYFSIKRIPLDFNAAAHAVEEDNPELNQCLVTAVERNLASDYSFLANRVVADAVHHPSRRNWELTGLHDFRKQRLTYLASLAGILAIILLANFSADRDIAVSQFNRANQVIDFSITIEPGDVEVERGSSLVVTARFTGDLPSNATLVTTNANGVEERSPMGRSLSDPIYALTLRRIDSDIRYSVEHSGSISETFSIQIFDLPRLAQANAALEFPTYTGWDKRVIDDTKRVSAIEGSQLDYLFNTNKPIAKAYLESPDGEIIDLESTNPENTQFAFNTVLESSLRYSLHLIDDKERHNAFPPQLRIEVIPNERPDLRFTHPRGDQRVSPLEEVALRGEASDDFGLLDYGIAFVVGIEDPILRSLKTLDNEDRAYTAEMRATLELENYNLAPRDMVSWYVWADDYDSNGETRRSTSDLYFADIRSLDEIFREQDGGGGGQPGGATPGEELIQKQQRISISLFRISQNETDGKKALEDMEVIRTSQGEVEAQLAELLPKLQDPSARDAGVDAQSYMQKAHEEMNTAIDQVEIDPLEEAWTASQGAYQALLKLTKSEYNISRSQNQGGGGAGRNRNQSQLDELEFRQEENRYETASEAQSLTSPENQKDLQLLSKLNELSRRQNDMNERLKELQSAMANANTEEEKERIERELKRLEEEQRDMLASADEAIQQAANRQSSREAREQLEEARETMQEAAESLEQGEVSQALASGTRAQDRIEETRDDLRNQASSEFGDAMRKARTQASDLAENQRRLDEAFENLNAPDSRRLDDSAQREQLAEEIDQQNENLNTLVEEIREITKGSESAEPALHRKLYDVMRDQNSSQAEERYDMSSQLLRQGFIGEAEDAHEGLAEDLDKLSETINDAAKTIFGDEGSTLRFAQQELDSLGEQLDEELSSAQQEGEAQAGQSQQGEGQQGEGGEQQASNGQGQPSSSPGIGNGGGLGDNPSIEDIERFIQNTLGNAGGQNQGAGPITGNGFGDWVDRLQTIESLLETPEARQRLAQARDAVESMRREFKRRGELPQWNMIEDGVVVPLNDVRAWLKKELTRIEQPNILQPVDRDPVPAEFAEAVKNYYESLGEE